MAFPLLRGHVAALSRYKRRDDEGKGARNETNYDRIVSGDVVRGLSATCRGLMVILNLSPGHDRSRADAGQDCKVASVAQRIRLGGHQVRRQLVCRHGDMHLGHALGPARHDAARVKRHTQVPGLGLEEPPRGVPQCRSHDLGRVEDQLDVHGAR